MELYIVMYQYWGYPCSLLLSTELRPIVLGGRSNLPELWLWRLISMGRNLCQSPQLKVGIYFLQLLINVSYFSFLICYPVTHFALSEEGNHRESKQEMFKREVCFPVSRDESKKFLETKSQTACCSLTVDVYSLFSRGRAVWCTRISHTPISLTLGCVLGSLLLPQPQGT